MNQPSSQPSFKKTWTIQKSEIRNPETRTERNPISRSFQSFWHSGFCVLSSGLTSLSPKYGEVWEVNGRNPITTGQNKLHPCEVKDEVRVKLMEVKRTSPFTPPASVLMSQKLLTLTGTLIFKNAITTVLSTPSPGGVREALRGLNGTFRGFSETLVGRLWDFSETLERRYRDIK